MSSEFVFFSFRFLPFSPPHWLYFLLPFLDLFFSVSVVCFLSRPRSCYALLCLLDVHTLHTTIFVPSRPVLSSCVLYYSLGVIIIL